ncbi:MAG: aminoacyl-tRNA hydrolase [Candidatus Methylopumilus sp.]|jgi:PTH1 family peptidyl-tRNA hydrolase|nr:aminoacyl-tRNA hydrolase [Candidatus Methylopumilus sp.]NBW60744.1 aminoacyl-tRNA hydrolase [Methylophilaceae bacterium]
MQAIQLIVGLGNPGNEYSKTRHNAGFWWVDLLCAQSNSRLNQESKFFGQAGKLNFSSATSKPSQDVWLLKPDTFMNASGRAVSALAKFYKIPPQAILVIHDELDLPVGVSKLKKGGGHGGHNGLRDIIAALGTPDFWRLRMGIGHPGKSEEVVNFVLRAPSLNEMNAIESSMDQSLLVLPLLLQGDFEQAMLRLHTDAKANLSNK